MKFIGKTVYYFGLPIIWLAFRGSTRAYVLLSVENEVLFVKSFVGDQKWKLPGGGVKKNEQPVEGAVREVFEETGIKIEKSQLSEILRIKKQHAGAKYTYAVFNAQLPQKPQINKSKSEILDAQWLKPSEINIRISNESTIKALEAAGFVTD